MKDFCSISFGMIEIMSETNTGQFLLSNVPSSVE